MVTAPAESLIRVTVWVALGHPIPTTPKFNTVGATCSPTPGVAVEVGVGVGVVVGRGNWTKVATEGTPTLFTKKSM